VLTPARVRGLEVTLVVLIVGSGCPPNDDDNSRSDETGGPPEAEPHDPFGGEGADPPGEPDRGRTYRSPSSLGNGLVHDSRFDLRVGAWLRPVSAAQLAAGVEWGSFVTPHIEKLRVGFRPAQVEANVRLELTNDIPNIQIEDRSVYVCDDDASYRSVTKTHVFFSNLDAEQAHATSGLSAPGSPRPTAIDSFALGPKTFGFNIVWTYDNAPVKWELVLGQSQTAFEATAGDLAQYGYHPISVSGRRRGGVSEYSGIFVQDGVAREDWYVMLGRNAMELADQVGAIWDAGYYPFRGSYQQGSESLPLFDVVWIKRSPRLKLELRFNLDEALFEEQDKLWRAAGYHLESATEYSDAGAQRFAGLWVMHEPYLRWTDGVLINPQDPKYIARYLPLDEQVIQQMTFADEPKVGEYFRPSSTLHIFEGDELVFNRAYTYAPAIYPDTPLDAPMGLASASKSITAAAVVQLMDRQKLDLTMPFAVLAGIDNVKAMIEAEEGESVPTVLDVLRHLGGFERSTTSYYDHSKIDQSIYGEYPITGEMMYDYVVQGGHLDDDKDEEDNYWSSDTYSMAQNSGELLYSNPGYSMLGELLRVRTGLSYEDYVRTQLLEPLNLQQRIYPDPGHRNAHRASTKAGLRSYLINTRHPYRVSDPTMPLLESEPVPRPPIDEGDGSPEWSVNAGPIDSSAPVTAASERHAGKYYLGGAPLAAGGWVADGKSLGLLTRVIARRSFLMPQLVAARMWDPQWRNGNTGNAEGWAYGLGWWVRGNWVTMAGGTVGSMALAAHNTEHDFTVVYLTNVIGNALIDVLNPIMMPVDGKWGTSDLGSQFPCVDDLTTYYDECLGTLVTY
jgi:CubicO group peptidase (beta-lactamase class C family)